MKLRKVKPEIRIVAFDDGPFKHMKSKNCILVGVVFRGGKFMDGILRDDIKVDGNDAEKKIIKMIKKSKFKDLRIIMLDGITFGGFNTVNIRNIFEKTGLPVIVVNRKKPNIKKFVETISSIGKHTNKRIKAVEDAGKMYKAKIKGKTLWFQTYGLEQKTAEEIIKISATHSNIPEPLRVAHIIASGIILGESRGRV